MELAIEEARKGVGFVAPNPLVGCVILSAGGELLGHGYHQRVGEAHAEVNALNSIENSAALNGAHVFVTMEPCAHEGRTPSCARALAKLPIGKVVYGLVDPNPRVAGHGLEILKQAGIRVEKFEGLDDELEDLAEIFLHNMRSSRPFVALKVGTSLDGFSAKKSGESQWITSGESRQHVQWLRGAYDAVLIGADTFLQDRPRLNSRDPQFRDRMNRVILLDPNGKTLSELKGSRLLAAREDKDVIVVLKDGINPPSGLNVQVVRARLAHDGNVDLDVMLKDLFALSVTSILVEGGSFVFREFFEKKQFQRIYVFLAPILLGESASVSWTRDLHLPTLAESVKFQHGTWRCFGPDMLFSGRLIP